MAESLYINVNRKEYDELLAERNLLVNNLSDLVRKEKELYRSKSILLDVEITKLDDSKHQLVMDIREEISNYSILNKIKFIFKKNK